MSAEVVGRGVGTEDFACSSLAGHGGLRLELPMAVRDSGVGALARTAARHCLRAWDVGETVLEAVLQVIAELVANVYEHTGGELAVLVIWHFPDCVRIEVSDFGEPKLEGTFPSLSVAEDSDESRRGLALVNSFSSRWGSRPNGERGLVRFAEIPSGHDRCVLSEGVPGDGSGGTAGAECDAEGDPVGIAHESERVRRSDSACR